MASEDEPTAKVQLYVYDLSGGLAKSLSPSFLGQTIEGIWHTGLVVFGDEYFYGGGIQRCKPGMTIAGRPTQIIDVGETAIPQSVFHEFLREIGSRFTPETYSIINHNCNNFTSEACQFLTGEDIPDWITGLPETLLQTPLGAMLRPMVEQFETAMKQQVGNAIPMDVPVGEFHSSQSPSTTTTSTPSQSSSSSSAQQTQQRGVSQMEEKVQSISNRSLEQQREAKEQQRETPKPPIAHPHKDLCLSSISVEPMLSQDDKASQFVKLVLKASNKKSNVDVGLTAAEIDLLKSLPDHLKSPKDEPTFPEVFELFERLIYNWSPQTLFPVVSLLRLLVLRPHANRYFTSEEGGISSIYTLLTEIGLTEEDPTAKTSPVCLMTLCLLSNLFSETSSAYRICSDEAFVNAALCVLSEKDVSIRLMGATVLFNCAIYLPRKSDDLSSQIAASLQEISDEEEHKIPRGRMLLAILHLAYCNTEIVQLFKALGFSPSTNPSEAAMSPKIKRIIGDINKLLDAIPEES